MSAFPCPHCAKPLDLAAFLFAVTAYDPSTRSSTSSCPGCGKALEFQVRGGVLTLGYTYWAGSFHFEGLVDVPARGLKLVEDEDGVRYEFGGARYRVPGDRA